MKEALVNTGRKFPQKYTPPSQVHQMETVPCSGICCFPSALPQGFLTILVKHAEELLLRSMMSTLYSSPIIVCLCQSDLWWFKSQVREISAQFCMLECHAVSGLGLCGRQNKNCECWPAADNCLCMSECRWTELLYSQAQDCYLLTTTNKVSCKFW